MIPKSRIEADLFAFSVFRPLTGPTACSVGRLYRLIEPEH